MKIWKDEKFICACKWDIRGMPVGIHTRHYGIGKSYYLIVPCCRIDEPNGGTSESVELRNSGDRSVDFTEVLYC